MSTPTIILKATRVTTFFVEEGDDTRMVVSAFRPAEQSIHDITKVYGTSDTFLLDIHDETGEYTTAMKWKATKLAIADDQKAFNLLLVKP